MKKGLHITTLVLGCLTLIVSCILTVRSNFYSGVSFNRLLSSGIEIMHNISLAMYTYLIIYCIKVLITKNYKASKWIINLMIIPVIHSIISTLEIIRMTIDYGFLGISYYLSFFDIFIFLAIFMHFYHNLYHGKDSKKYRIMFLIGCLLKIAISFVPLITDIVDLITETNPLLIWEIIYIALGIITYIFIIFAFYDSKVEVKQGEAKRYSLSLGVDLAIKIPMTVVVSLVLIWCLISGGYFSLFIILWPVIVFYSWVYEVKFAKWISIVESGLFIILFLLSLIFGYRFFTNFIFIIFALIVTIVLLVLTIVLDKTGRRIQRNVYYAPNPYQPVYNNYQRPVVNPVKEDKYDKLLKNGEITNEDYIALKKEKSKKDKYEVLLENGSITKEEYETLKKTKTKKKKESN